MVEGPRCAQPAAAIRSTGRKRRLLLMGAAAHGGVTTVQARSSGARRVAMTLLTSPPTANPLSEGWIDDTGPVERRADIPCADGYPRCDELQDTSGKAASKRWRGRELAGESAGQRSARASERAPLPLAPAAGHVGLLPPRQTRRRRRPRRPREGRPAAQPERADGHAAELQHAGGPALLRAQRALREVAR